MIDDYAYQERVAIMVYDGMIDESIARIVAKIETLQDAIKKDVITSNRRRYESQLSALKKQYWQARKDLYQCSLFK